ncbi:stage II sporulation protein D [Caldalkalibacillus uzonensis]|uniref:Stage II sporulation protein D n=1 Tax=Caldalkalibacillus uzonensis TaxID=353224 RepID=A0ABU0CTL8_9BACI|nr:stage II sporulation protein D [Caldalkalibacillus uzonensis]MDQ0339438.1 stage II sporulation protein D [Caldalkalibacillus uzonensis]
MRTVLIISLGLLIVLLIVPSVVAQFIPHGSGQAAGEIVQLEQPDPSETPGPEIMVRVYRTATKTIEKVPLEEYVRGVVASEMPHDFELEALKAQAMAARTYIIRRMMKKDFSDTPEGADVRDDVGHQVYKNEEELRRQWGKAYPHKISRINQAVNETRGKVITYNGKPIDATFFSTSNGYTENAEDYWGQEIPYLKSVNSPWDKDSPRFREEIRLSLAEFQHKLGVELSVPVSSGQPFAEIVSRSEGQRVTEVQVGDKTFTGREIRELLGLPSSDFNWSLAGNEVVITTTGYGHGVGMSQYGANGMAAEGHTAEEIVKYYYRDVAVEDYRQWIVKK